MDSCKIPRMMNSSAEELPGYRGWSVRGNRRGGTHMAPIEGSIDIDRRPEEVFAYATDFSRFEEWQEGVLSVCPEGDPALAVGSRAVVTRQAGPRRLTAPEEIVELNSPRTWSVRADAGPVT